MAAKSTAFLIPIQGEDNLLWSKVMLLSLLQSTTSKIVVFASLAKKELDWFSHLCMVHTTEDDTSFTSKLVDFLKLDLYSEICVLSATTLVLESPDGVFETSQLGNYAASYLLENNGMTLRSVSDMVNQGKLLNYIDNFCLISGQLSGNGLKACPGPIIYFKNHNTVTNVVDKMIQLGNSKLGMAEKKVVQHWLKNYDNLTSSSIPRPIETKNEAIAIVGIGFRSPGANTLDEFWTLLKNCTDTITTPPATRWTQDLNPRSGSDKQIETQAGFLTNPIEEFDSKFFGISPKDASYLDPQGRLLHEVCWEALENAAINPQTLRATHTGIFAGMWQNDYRGLLEKGINTDYLAIAMSNCFGATVSRVSLFFGLTGPALAVNTFCSASLSAIDLAVKSLRMKETNLSLACGVNLFVQPHNSLQMTAVLSPSERCRTYDADADGYVRAEGCGVLVLKRLETALRDRDNIWAVIRGIGTAQEGLSPSLGTPTVDGEALAMKRALKDARVQPEQVTFVEAHGTGTAVGDPMEVAAIEKAYSTPKRKEPLVIGSVKTNVGHTESCSAMMGIAKAVLSMKHHLIPRHRNVDNLNPLVAKFLETIPARIPLERNLDWKTVDGQPRVCAVSSFGITGTDGHLILEEAPKSNPLSKFTLGLQRPKHLLTISAKSKESLGLLLSAYEKLFASKSSRDDDRFGDYAYTANVCRAQFPQHRVCFSASSFAEALKILQSKGYTQGEPQTGELTPPKICFLFPGQGSQYAGMAATLYDTSPIFRIYFDKCDRILWTEYNVSLPTLLWGPEANEDTLSRTSYSQTSIFCVEYCLVKLWESWGVQPDFVLGHSLGESCAAVAAGIMTLEQGLRLVASRSHLIDKLPPGKMLVVKASEKEVKALLTESQTQVDIAATNMATQTVVSGEPEQIEKFAAFLSAREMKGTILKAKQAFHSHMLDHIRDDVEDLLKDIDFPEDRDTDEIEVGYISAVKGKLIKRKRDIKCDYWVQHMRQPVRFVEACAALQATGATVCLEVGAQAVLSSMVTSNVGPGITCLPSLRKNAEDWTTLLTTLEQLWILGVPINWEGFDAPYLREKVALPLYPFHRKPHWVEDMPLPAPQLHPLAGTKVETPSTQFHLYEQLLTSKTLGYLEDHVLGDQVIFPGACFTEIVLGCGYWFLQGGRAQPFSALPPTRGVTLQNLKISSPLQLFENNRTTLTTLITSGVTDNNNLRVEIHTKNAGEGEENDLWITHASAVVSGYEKEHVEYPIHDLGVAIDTQPQDPKRFYEHLASVGLRFGPRFKTIQKFWSAIKRNPEKKEEGQRVEVVAEVQLAAQDGAEYLLHPLLIDGFFQTVLLLGFLQEGEKMGLSVPVSIDEMHVWPTSLPRDTWTTSTNVFYIHTIQDEDTGFCKATLLLCRGQGEAPTWSVISQASQVALVPTTVERILSSLQLQKRSLPHAWKESWKVIGTPFKHSLKHGVASELRSFLQNYSAPETEPLQKIVFEQTKQLCFNYIISSLHQLGWSPEVDDMVTLESLRDQMGVGKTLLLGRQLRHLEMGGYLEKVEGVEEAEMWIVKRTFPSLQKLKKEAEQLLSCLTGRPETKVNAAIIQHVSSKLPGILRGEISAQEILFHKAGEAKDEYSARTFSKNHPSRAAVMQTFEEIAERLFTFSKSLNKAEETGGVLRVLEVGSGPTLSLLHLLKKVWPSTTKTNYEYFITEVSQEAETQENLEEFKQNVTGLPFKVNESPAFQGVPCSFFDFIFVTQTQHETELLRDILVHLRHTMKPGGIVLFPKSVSFDETFISGLLEDHSPAPTKDALLRSCGFENVRSIPVYLNQVEVVTATAAPLDAQELVRVSECCVTGRHLSTESKKRWYLFAEINTLPLVVPLAGMLVASGLDLVVVIRKETSLERILEAYHHLPPAARVIETECHDIPELLEDAATMGGVIFTWGISSSQVCEQNQVANGFLVLVQKILRWTNKPKLFVLTRGSQPVDNSGVMDYPSGAILLGMTRCLKNEQPQLFVRLVDLDSSVTPEELASQVMYEFASTARENEDSVFQVAYRAGVRYEPRFEKARSPSNDNPLTLPSATDRYKLRLSNTKLIVNLAFVPLGELPELQNTQVLIRVSTYALNFRDILTVQQPHVDFETFNALGLDWAGEVIQAGGGVQQLRVGDRVFGVNFKLGSQLNSHLIREESSVVPVPESMSEAEAATMPFVFYTAHYCLVTLAQVKIGETVLIHTGSGGVGLAAIQVARHAGARIITTAGSDRKRSYLRSLGLEHVFASRDTSFEQEISRVTYGRGVDVVLNSITGPGIKEATLRITAQGARFIEMSKLHTWTPEEVHEQRPDVDYQLVDFAHLSEEKLQALHHTMMQNLAMGILKPLPYVRFDALNIRQALNYLQKSEHIGKVIITMPKVVKAEEEGGKWITDVPLFNNRSTYLITGGLGGIGWQVAKWMLENGATDLVLVGRSAPTPEVAQEITALLQKHPSCHIIVRNVNVAQFTNLQVIIEEIRLKMKPLRGVFHAAGLLRDSLLENQTWAAFEDVFAPKVQGTWNLHQLTKDINLEHFVLFSSIVALMGLPGQSNYAAANCFQDAVANYRQARGLPATTVNWGQWAEVGLAKELNMPGFLPVAPQRMLNGLGALLRNANPVQLCYSEFDSFLKLSYSAPTLESYLEKGLLTQRQRGGHESSAQLIVNEDAFWRDFEKANTRQEKFDVVADVVENILRGMLRMGAEDEMGVGSAMADIGVDSLVRTNFKNSLRKLFLSRIDVGDKFMENLETIQDVVMAALGALLPAQEQQQTDNAESGGTAEC